MLPLLQNKKQQHSKKELYPVKRNKILREGKSYTYYAPYGYDYSKETKMLSINEKQAQVVKRIFQLSIDGYSTERIAILLNAEKIPTKGKKGELDSRNSLQYAYESSV